MSAQDPPGRRPANAGKRYRTQILAPDEVLAVLRRCSRTAPTGLRNRALITLLYRGGLKLSEALELAPDDVDLRGQAVAARAEDGADTRTVYLDPLATAVLERWVTARARIVSRHAPLICTLKGDPVDPSYVRKLLHRLGRQAHIDKRVHPAGLRRTHAIELELEGAPAAVIDNQLGLHTARPAEVSSQLLDHVRARPWPGGQDA
jgi:site-specific recombinase XerD